MTVGGPRVQDPEMTDQRSRGESMLRPPFTSKPPLALGRAWVPYFKAGGCRVEGLELKGLKERIWYRDLAPPFSTPPFPAAVPFGY